MNLLSQIISLVLSGLSSDLYYKNMNLALKRLNDEYTMLHFPLYKNDTDNFLQSQKNLTDYCISVLDSIKGKKILEIGCGNGVQAKYIQKKFEPRFITGIDLDKSSIEIANMEKKRKHIRNIQFLVDDAQDLSKISSQSYDVVINIESAFHYPDKVSFLKQIYRVLKPGGHFLIADILSTKGKGSGIRKMWKKRMILHHWHKYNYDQELANVNLKISHIEDITNKVIAGFMNYRNWIREMKKTNLLNDLIFKIFYIINIHWNLFLLRNRRQYLIYAGIKAV